MGVEVGVDVGCGSGVPLSSFVGIADCDGVGCVPADASADASADDDGGAPVDTSVGTVDDGEYSTDGAGVVASSAQATLVLNAIAPHISIAIVVRFVFIENT